jgi:hypothetical protein
MKFTLDTEKKVIYFKESFTKEDIEYLFTLLKIDDIETWKIDMEYTLPTLSPNQIIPGTTFPYTINPYVVTCQSGTNNISSSNTLDCYATTNTMSFSLLEN